MRRARQSGFTLVEILIALAVTAFVAAAAYAGLSAVVDGVERTRVAAQRTAEIDRALSLLSRDIRQLADRAIRNGFGEWEPALTGGRLAPFPLTLTRAGWHNPAGHPRSTLERVSYVFEEQSLWRLRYPVLDRAGDSAAARVRLLEDVEGIELRFLDRIDALRSGNDTRVDTRDWTGVWVATAGGTPAQELTPPVAVELRLELADLGLITRLYVLPPL